MRKSSLLMLAAVVGVVTLTSGCLFIGNRGGLGGDERKLLEDIKTQINESEARIYKLEHDAGKQDTPCGDLKEENERLRRLLSENNIEF